MSLIFTVPHIPHRGSGEPSYTEADNEELDRIILDTLRRHDSKSTCQSHMYLLSCRGLDSYVVGGISRDRDFLLMLVSFAVSVTQLRLSVHVICRRRRLMCRLGSDDTGRKTSRSGSESHLIPARTSSSEVQSSGLIVTCRRSPRWFMTSQNPMVCDLQGLGVTSEL